MTTMMDLDFLPEDYEQRRESAQLPTIHVAVAACVAVVVGIAATTCAVRRHQLDEQLASMSIAFNQAASDMQQLTRVSRQLGESRRDAYLGVCLTGPVPRSRALAELARQTPPGVRLSRLTIAPQGDAGPPQPAASPSRRAAAARPAPAEPSQLERLVAEALRPSQVVLEGRADSASQAHNYVSRLQQAAFLAEVELDSLRGEQQQFVFRVLAKLQAPAGKRNRP